MVFRGCLGISGDPPGIPRSRSRSRGGSPKAGIDNSLRCSSGLGHDSPYTKDSLDNPGFIDDRISQRTFLEGSRALEDDFLRKS